MRRRWIGAAAVLVTAACGSSPGPAPAPATPLNHSAVQRIDPSRIKRVGTTFPPGYEVTGMTGPSSPAGIWRLGQDATADPPQCGALVDPVGAPGEAAQGVLGSGPGGIVSAVVTAASSDSADRAAASVAGCRRWILRDGRAAASVRLVDAPYIEGVRTLGLAADIRTVVEGGSEILSRAHTFAAYLGTYCVFATVITDPGSPHPALEPRFAADLLVAAVSALRTPPPRVG